jgi:hypothetical protein
MRIFVFMKKIILSLLFVGCKLLAQNDSMALKFSKLIAAENLREHLAVLASDEYEGRETGKKGQKMAAAYIAEHFKKCGASPVNGNYFQPFSLTLHQPQQLKISVNDKTFQSSIDYFSPSAIFKDTTLVITKFLFAGFGISDRKYDDYLKTDSSVSAIMIMQGEPLKKSKDFLLGKGKTPSMWTAIKRAKMDEAKRRGKKIVLIVEDDFEQSLQENSHRIYSGRMRLAEDEEKNPGGIIAIHLSKRMADELLRQNGQTIQKLTDAINTSEKPNSFEVATRLELKVFQTHESIQSENVVGYVEGTDLKDELIVVTAHYDHLGIQDNAIYNGADDDGSGTVAVMELANAFAAAKIAGAGPRRSMLFMTVAGEEKGLLGSDYYSRHPLFPLKNTVADLNIDMIGRVDDEHKGNPDYVYIIGSNMLSNELNDINEICNRKYVQLKLDYKFNSKDDPNRYYYRSDHYNFAKHNIPVIFYFNGVHEDYHQETDEVSKINFLKIEKITRLVFFTAWDLANRNERLKLNKQ